MPHSLKTTAAAALAAGMLIVASQASAADAQRVRVRGDITSLTGDTLVVKTREGTDQTIIAEAGLEGRRHQEGVGRRHQAR
jgi:hypothetical protein